MLSCSGFSLPQVADTAGSRNPKKDLAKSNRKRSSSKVENAFSQTIHSLNSIKYKAIKKRCSDFFVQISELSLTLNQFQMHSPYFGFE